MRRICNTLINNGLHLKTSSSSSYVRSISQSIKQCGNRRTSLNTSISLSLNQQQHRPFHSTYTHISALFSEKQVLGSSTYQVNNQPDTSRVSNPSITQDNKQSNYSDPDELYDVMWTCALLVGASLASAAITRYVVSQCAPREEHLDYSDTLISLPVSTTNVTSAYQTKSPAWVFRVNSFFVGLVLLTRVLGAVIFLWLASWAL